MACTGDVSGRSLGKTNFMMQNVSENKAHISARISEYSIPPLKDMLVLGKDAPIGCIAMRRSLELLVRTPFAHIELKDDDIVSDILIRQPLLRRISENLLISFVMQQVKPMMGADEVLQVELDIKIFLAANT